MPQTRRPNFDQVRSWLNDINREKTAAAKSAKAYSELEGRGSTTHPVKDVNDGLSKATTGSRASENEKDVKDMNFTGQVDSTPENPGKSQDELNYNIGTQQSETGGQPSVEDDYKTRPEDPGTTHPANTEDEGKKYGSWVKARDGRADPSEPRRGMQHVQSRERIQGRHCRPCQQVHRRDGGP
jgi:hypothetical protein